MRYHVNPVTGDAGPCRARTRPCPFGLPDEHFASAEAARGAYESFMGGGPAPLSWLLTPRGQTLHRHPDPEALTRDCFEESEAFKAQFPEQGEGKWTWRSWPNELRWYTMGGFAPINAVLRGLEADSYGDRVDPEVKPRIAEAIATIDRLFTRVPARPRRLYRFVSMPGLTRDEFIALIETEGGIEDPAYTSASASMDFALTRALEKPEKNYILLEIATDQPALPMQEDAMTKSGDIQSLEHEYVLRRGARFDLVNVERRAHLELGPIRERMFHHYDWCRSKTEKAIMRRDAVRFPLVRLVHRA